MYDSVRALLTQVVDYAGLFPPASLSLDEAVRNYARYRVGEDAWMLGRFICPAARLAELAKFNELQTGPPWAISVLGRGGATQREFLDAFKADRETVKAHQGRMRMEAFEVRLPADVLESGGESARTLITQAAALVPQPLTAWYEAAFPGDWRKTLVNIIEALKGRGGLKVRCGGQTAAAFPSIEQLASAIATCREAGVPMKFTAGLHHPIRQFDASLQTKMHGFLNVFGAGVLVHARNLKAEDIQEILAEEDASTFVFDEAGFHWKNWHATRAEIVTARREFVTSFGSCSFDEPREDLRQLGLLP